MRLLLIFQQFSGNFGDCNSIDFEKKVYQKIAFFSQQKNDTTCFSTFMVTVAVVFINSNVTL